MVPMLGKLPRNWGDRMKLFPDDPSFIPGEVGFDTIDPANDRRYDLLGRKPIGQKLTDLVDRIDQPLVIALDGGWGSGKSHFLKLWTGAHKLELGGKADVIYFDAFEHDFLDDPLISLVSRLTSEKAKTTWTTKALRAVKKAAFPLAKLGTRVGLAVATTGATEIISAAVGDTAITKIAEATEGTIDQFWKAEAGRIASMQGFREALTALTKSPKKGGDPQKLVFIVDELDRCRPDYALALLEIIKHFFTVPNVHFVLGTNLTALENSVRARYGDRIEATKYLQKFVSLSMHLPKSLLSNPDQNAAMSYFQAMASNFVQSTKIYEECFHRFARPVEIQNASLRDVQRLLTCMALLSNSFDQRGWGYQNIIVGALYLKVVHPTAYSQLRAQRISLKEIVGCLSLEKPKNENDYARHYLDWAVWAYVLEGPNALKAVSVPTDYAEAVSRAFGTFGNGFRWPTAHAFLAEAFDTFTLPNS